MATKKAPKKGSAAKRTATPKPVAPAAKLALEKQYSVYDIASLWNVDRKTVTRLFRDRLGVLKISAPGNRPTQHARYTLRIPESVMISVYEEYSA